MALLLAYHSIEERDDKRAARANITTGVAVAFWPALDRERLILESFLVLQFDFLAKLF